MTYSQLDMCVRVRVFKRRSIDTNMYVCIYIYMYAYIYIYKHSVLGAVCNGTDSCIDVMNGPILIMCMCTSIHKYMEVSVCICNAKMHACIRTYTCIHTGIQANTYRQLRTYIDTCMHTDKQIYRHT